jgi:hypothetical protein
MMSPKRAPRQGGGTGDRRLDNEHAVGVEEPEREGERQLDGVHLDAEPTLLAVGRQAANLHRQLDEAPEQLGRPGPGRAAPVRAPRVAVWAAERAAAEKRG